MKNEKKLPGRGLEWLSHIKQLKGLSIHGTGSKCLGTQNTPGRNELSQMVPPSMQLPTFLVPLPESFRKAMWPRRDVGLSDDCEEDELFCQWRSKLVRGHESRSKPEPGQQ